jgi:hypothetical protein
MANDDKPSSNRSGHPVRVPSKVPTERPFDRWLQKQLHAMYDEIASEPLPDDLLGLIDRDARSKTASLKPSSTRKSPPSGTKK